MTCLAPYVAKGYMRMRLWKLRCSRIGLTMLEKGPKILVKRVFLSVHLHPFTITYIIFSRGFGRKGIRSGVSWGHQWGWAEKAIPWEKKPNLTDTLDDVFFLLLFVLKRLWLLVLNFFKFAHIPLLWTLEKTYYVIFSYLYHANYLCGKRLRSFSRTVVAL